MRLPSNLNVNRLGRAMLAARRSLQFFREERRRMVQQYVGAHWSTEGAAREIPLNLIGLYVGIVGRALVSHSPRVMISTFHAQSRPLVSKMEGWVNRQFREMRLGDELHRVVLDALFSIGVMKTGLIAPQDAARFGYQRLSGEAFAERVDLDDLVFDVFARDWSELSFIGHRVRVPLEAARQLWRSGRNKRKPPLSTSDQQLNETGDERIGLLGRSTEAGRDGEFEEMTDIWEIYLPRRSLVLTLAGPEGGLPESEEDVLEVREWIGPASGPYSFLGFNIVPGNVMPKGPIQDLVALHEAVNRQLRKLINQADRLKEVLPVRNGLTDEANRLRQASDGEMFQADNADTMRSIVFGGPNPQIFALMTALKDLFSWLAGNLDVMGGLASQSRTATQERLLAENSSRTIGAMQQAVISFVTQVVRNLCWYYHHDPLRIMRTTHAPAGLPEATIVRLVTPDDRRKVDWDDLDIQIDPYSMSSRSPASRTAFLNQVVAQLLPILPILQQQGVFFDVNYYIRQLSLYGNEPDLTELFKVSDPPQASLANQSPGESLSGQAGPREPQERINVSEQTRSGADEQLARSLMGERGGPTNDVDRLASQFAGGGFSNNGQPS